MKMLEADNGCERHEKDQPRAQMKYDASPEKG